MTNLKRFQDALATLSLDGAIISSDANQRYLSDFHFSDGYIFVTQKEAYLLTDSRYIEAAKRSVTHMNVLLATAGMTDTLKHLISDSEAKRIAIEDASLSCADYNRFSKEFSEIALTTGASDILKNLRAVKSPAEIERIEAAQRITDAAFSHILNFISPKRTEKEIALELEFFMRKSGADGIAFDQSLLVWSKHQS